MTNMKIVKSGYKFASGPNGNLYVTVNRKPHLCYSIEAALALGIIGSAA